MEIALTKVKYGRSKRLVNINHEGDAKIIGSGTTFSNSQFFSVNVILLAFDTKSPDIEVVKLMLLDARERLEWVSVVTEAESPVYYHTVKETDLKSIRKEIELLETFLSQ